MKFPIMGVVKESLGLVSDNAGKAILSLLFYCGGLIFVFLIAGVAIVLASAGNDIDLETLAAGDLTPLLSTSTFLIFIPTMFLAVMVITHVFNSWVIVGATGHGKASIPGLGEKFKRAAINALKFILIAIPLGIAVFLIYLLTSALGLSPGLDETAQSPTTQYLSTITPTIILVVIQSLIFSVFSANFTYTALGSTSEGVEHPHTVDFAVVLRVLYGIVVVVSLLIALLGVDLLFSIVQLIVGFLLTLAAAVAHGVRYRACADDHGESVLSAHLSGAEVAAASGSFETEAAPEAVPALASTAVETPANPEPVVSEKPAGNGDSIE